MEKFIAWFSDHEFEAKIYELILKVTIFAALSMSIFDYIFYVEHLALLELIFSFTSMALLYTFDKKMMTYETSTRIFIFVMAYPIYWNLLYNPSVLESTILFIFLPLVIVTLRPMRETVWLGALFGGSFIVFLTSGMHSSELSAIELFKTLMAFSLITIFLTIYVLVNRSYQHIVEKQSLELKEANLELEALYIKKSIEASTDALTGLDNRSSLMYKMEYFYAQYKRKKEIFSLIIFDLDFFKDVNDTYGHLEGDEVLRQVSSVASDAVREIDTLARYGGEEFIVVLPGTNLSLATQVAERIRSDIEKTVSVPDRAITASFGVVEIEDDMRIKDMIHYADLALYRAKEKGRNRVETALSD